MSLLRIGGRASLARVFVSSGLDVLIRPEQPTATAGWLFGAARAAAPVPVPPDVHLVRANAAVQVAAGAGLLIAADAPDTARPTSSRFRKGGQS